MTKTCGECEYYTSANALGSKMNNTGVCSAPIPASVSVSDSDYVEYGDPRAEHCPCFTEAMNSPVPEGGAPAMRAYPIMGQNKTRNPS